MRILLIAFLLLAGCDNPFGRDEPSMAGAWASTDGVYAFTAQQNKDGSVFGTGTRVGLFGGVTPIEIHGVNSYPNVSFTLVRSSGSVSNFQGTFTSPGRVAGTLTGRPETVFVRQ